MRKYEAIKLSSSMRDDNLLEDDFYDVRDEPEGSATRYIQGIAPLPTGFAGLSCSPSIAGTFAPSPSATVLPYLDGSISRLARSDPPVSPDRPPLPISRAHRHIVERKRLAGPSNSGAELASYTNTGSEMRVCYIPHHPNHVNGCSDWYTRGLAQTDAPRAQEIVRAEQKLFEYATAQVLAGGPMSPPSFRHHR